MKALIFLCCSPLLVFSQKLKTSVDKLTGDTTFCTTSYNLFSPGLNNSGVNFHLSKNTNYKLFIMEVSISKFFPEVKEGEEINFKLANGDIVTLYSRTKFKSEPYDDFSKPIEFRHFLLSPEYILDDISLNKLKQSSVVLIRFHYDACFNDYEFKQEDTQILIKTLQSMFP
jgi:hypothetical protein